VVVSIGGFFPSGGERDLLISEDDAIMDQYIVNIPG
jgi:hypothetical protein